MTNVLKNILIIGTGGTIAGCGNKRDESEYVSGYFKATELVEQTPEIKELANLTFEDNIFRKDSLNILVDDLIKLACYVEEKAKSDEVDGIVITHGTDTLEETAYFLNLTVHTNKPIVLTGSIRPATYISSDGPMNLFQAVALATDENAKGKGVMVVFSNSIYHARDVTKLNNFKTEAFNQNSFGFMSERKAFICNETIKLHTSKSEFKVKHDTILQNVNIIEYYLGIDTKILDYVLDNSNGIVLGGAGGGGCSEEWNETIKEALRKNIPIVRSSRICNGLVNYPEDQIKDKGVCANDLSPQKSRVLLMLALSNGKKKLEEIQEIFNKY